MRKYTFSANRDLIIGSKADDTIESGLGNDFIFSGRGNDVIDAGQGNDRIFAGRGNDIINAGEGNDLVFAGRGNDIVNAGDGDDYVKAGKGDDQIDAGSGDDYIRAGKGDDIIKGGEGDDIIRGGKGFDTAVYESSVFDYLNADNQLDLTSHRGKLIFDTQSDEGIDTLRNIEALQFDDATFLTDGTNNGPIARDSEATTHEDETLTIDVSGDVVDLDGDTLTVSSATASSGATVVINSDNTLSYDANGLFDSLALGESMVDTVEYEVSDGNGGTATATVSVIITGSNDAPVVTSTHAAVSVEEGSEIINGVVTSSDVDNNATVTYSAMETAGFSIDESTGEYSFDPSNEAYESLGAGEELSVIIPVTVMDEHGDSDTTELVFNLTGVAETPQYNTLEDNPFAGGTENTYDPYGGYNPYGGSDTYVSASQSYDPYGGYLQYDHEVSISDYNGGLVDFGELVSNITHQHSNSIDKISLNGTQVDLDIKLSDIVKYTDEDNAVIIKNIGPDDHVNFENDLPEGTQYTVEYDVEKGEIRLDLADDAGFLYGIENNPYTGGTEVSSGGSSYGGFGGYGGQNAYANNPDPYGAYNQHGDTTIRVTDSDGGLVDLASLVTSLGNSIDEVTLNGKVDINVNLSDIITFTDNDNDLIITNVTSDDHVNIINDLPENVEHTVSFDTTTGTIMIDIEDTTVDF